MAANPTFADKLYAMECTFTSAYDLPMSVLASKCLDAYILDTQLTTFDPNANAPDCSAEVIISVGQMAQAAELRYPELKCLGVYEAAASG